MFIFNSADPFSMHAVGVLHTVSAMGTAISREQVSDSEMILLLFQVVNFAAGRISSKVEQR